MSTFSNNFNYSEFSGIQIALYNLIGVQLHCIDAK